MMLKLNLGLTLGKVVNHETVHVSGLLFLAQFPTYYLYIAQNKIL